MNRRPYQCPACYRQVFLSTPVAAVTPQGTVVVDVSTLAAALNMHLRTGCEANT